MSQASDFTKKNQKYLLNVAVFAIMAFLLSGCEFNIPSLSTFFNKPVQTSKTEYVKGLEGIVKYPDSEFLYEGNEDAPEVQKLLANYNSAYRLTNSTEFIDAVDFYKSNLKKSGWKFEKEVQPESKTEKYGFYWSKNDKGLRIYQQINDIWYETITAEESKTGLANLVALEAKEYYNPENLVKLSSVVQTDWDIDFPDSWEVKQQNSSYSKGLDVIFKYTLGGFEMRIQDLGKELGTDLSSVSTAYLGKINKNRPASEVYELSVDYVEPQGEISQFDELDEPSSVGSDEADTTVTNSTPPTKPNPESIKLNGLDAMELRLVKKDTNAKAYITFVKHPRTARFYAIVNIIGDKEFYEYLKIGLKAK